MQKGVNKVILIGNLGQEPDVRFMPSGGAVANITIATSETWRDKQNGEQKEKTEWHRVVLFGKLAEVAGEYLKKGSKVYIEGQLQTRKWQNQQGQDQYTTEVVVQGFNGVMQMLDGRQDNKQKGYQQNQGGFQQHNANQGGFQQKQSAPQFGGPNSVSQQQGQPQRQQSAANAGNQNQDITQQNGQGYKVQPPEPTIAYDDDIPFRQFAAHPMAHLLY